MANLKILISEDSEEQIESIREIFSKNFRNIRFVAKNELRIINEIYVWKPDAVILDLFSIKVDAMNVISRVKRANPADNTLFTVIAEVGNANIERELKKKGVTYFVTKPFYYEEVAEKIFKLLTERIFLEEEELAKSKKNLTKEQVSTAVKDNFEMEIKVSDILHQIGVPAHIKGYRYIRRAVMMAIQNPSAIHSVTKILYPSVAQQFETTPSRVERAIRHAIEVAWSRGDIDTLNSYFSYTIHTSRGKPTNSEFIALISDTLRIRSRSA